MQHTTAAAAPVYRGNIWRLFAVQALLMFILWVPIWVVFLQRKGLSLTEVGLLEGVAWTITAFLEVPTGAIADRWGRKASIALGASLYGLAMFLILADALSPAFLVGIRALEFVDRVRERRGLGSPLRQPQGGRTCR